MTKAKPTVTQAAFMRKQMGHQLAEEVLDDDGYPTIWAMGGFVPEEVSTKEELTEFFKKSPPYKYHHRDATIEVVVDTENRYRLQILELMRIFLERLAKDPHANVHKTLKACGMTRHQAFELRDRIPMFAQRWREIYDAVTDEIESAGIKRAVKGVTKPVFQGGVQVGQVQEYSDSLLALLLKGRRRDVYGMSSGGQASGGEVDGELHAQLEDARLRLADKLEKLRDGRPI